MFQSEIIEFKCKVSGCDNDAVEDTDYCIECFYEKESRMIESITESCIGCTWNHHGCMQGDCIFVDKENLL